MKSALFPLTLLFALALSVPGAVAMETATLDETMRAGLGGHPLLLAAEAEVATTDAAYRASARQYLPRLTLSEQFYATNEPAGSLFISLNQEKL